MTDFDFTAVKATVSKPAEVPAIERPRNLAENPFTGHFAKSIEKQDENGNGKWMNMILPGKTSVTDKGAKHYGDVATKAMNYLRSAARDAGFGIGLRIVDMEDGNVQVHYRSQPRRVVNRKPAENK